MRRLKAWFWLLLVVLSANPIVFPDLVRNLFLSTGGLLTFRRTKEKKERSFEIIKNIEFPAGNKGSFATTDDVKGGWWASVVKERCRFYFSVSILVAT
ncbi:MAG: hypothetical protein R3F51_05935 [Cyanobacteriota/Melainabacteria group bacterium]